jgi:hydroxymethylpyrimidine/phosphomethylpyrimidine kinase
MKCILIVAALDNGGGAGLLQDQRTAEALGFRAVFAVTGLTNQNDDGLQEIRAVPADFLRSQIRLMRTSYPIAGVKIGAICSGEQVEVLREELGGLHPVILDPVLNPTRGTGFLNEAGQVELTRLFPTFDLLTPNLPELKRLARITGIPGRSPEVLARLLCERFGTYIYVKGGHGTERRLHEWLVGPGSVDCFDRPRLSWKYAHGTGCMFSTAVLCYWLRGLSLREACEQGALFTALHFQQINEAGYGDGEVQPIGFH